ncbi:MAG: VOC family protein [Myxococcota bacterium]
MRIDRVQMAVPDRARAAEGWIALLGARHEGDDRVKGLGALRSRYRLGCSWLELLEPDGSGVVSEAVARRGAHLFAAGIGVPDVGALAARLAEHGVSSLAEGDQLHLDSAATGDHGLRGVVSSDAEVERVGRVEHLYEVTNLVHDVDAAVARTAALLGLDSSVFVPIDSPHYGYRGTLTLFDPDRLDRFEVIQPHVPSNTMGRFFGRHGECLYMAFAESGDLDTIVDLARERGLPFTAVPAQGDPPTTVFLHPQALGGMMLGLSWPGSAWTWSGHPERARSRT